MIGTADCFSPLVAGKASSATVKATLQGGDIQVSSSQVLQVTQADFKWIVSFNYKRLRSPKICSQPWPMVHFRQSQVAWESGEQTVCAVWKQWKTGVLDQAIRQKEFSLRCFVLFRSSKDWMATPPHPYTGQSLPAQMLKSSRNILTDTLFWCESEMSPRVRLKVWSSVCQE